LAIIKSHEGLWRALERRGPPKYLFGREEGLKPSRVAKSHLIGRGVLKKKTWDFSLLITVPEARLKMSIFF
jgi:hypothetical protein